LCDPGLENLLSAEGLELLNAERYATEQRPEFLRAGNMRRATVTECEYGGGTIPSLRPGLHKASTISFGPASRLSFSGMDVEFVLSEISQ